MSLQLLAKQMEAKGRKGDSMLVHMTAKEVAALQKMAESAGGSLSVNPETGLVEANFLKRMLPTLVGIGVGAATMNPYLGAAAGAAVGGYQAKRNDQDVLLGAAMGGLGGYGGASLAGGLTSAGAGAAQQTAMSAIPQGATTAAHTAAQNAAMQGLSGSAANQAAAEASKTLMAQGFGSDAAIQNLAAAQASKQFVAQPALTQMGQGISALGKEAGRDAFMSQVGGGAGLAKTASMAATPLMAAGKRPGEPEADDEMYSYTFDPGRTNVERTPTDSTAERRYFDSSFSPMRRIRARDYGYAEGGETAAPAMNASDAAYAYLMGDSPSSTGAPTASQAGLSYLMGERSSSAPVRGPSFTDGQTSFAPAASRAPVVGGDNMYAFDPATGTFLRNPNIPGASTSGSPVGTSFSGSGGGDGYTQPSTPFDTMSPAQQAAYYADNPTMGAITRAGQTAFGYTGLGRAQDLFAPGFQQEQRDIASGNFYGYDDSPPDMSGFESPSNQSYSAPGDDSMDFGPSDSSYGAFFAAGGLMGLAKGGMKSGGFVVPADVVSMIGEGNTDAGYSRIKSMIPGATAIKGKDGGQADTVKTSIEGKQPARVAHGEMYIPPETVKRMGGAKKLYAMMDRVREQATGSKKQIKPVSLKQAMA